MSQAGETPEKQGRQQALRMALLGVIGQAGCLTLGIVLAALGAGLWLDSQLHTRPLFALVLVLGSIPVTLFLMVRLVLSVAPRIQVRALEATKGPEKEDGDRGER
jgi:hypothetical protein